MANQVLIAAAAPKGGAPLDVRKNKEAIKETIREAAAIGAQALIMPELCLSASGAGSLFSHPHFLTACLDAALEIAKECEGITCAFGLPVTDGKKTYNALAVAGEGRILSFVIKKNLKQDQALFFETVCPDSLRVKGESIPCARQAKLPLPLPSAVLFYDDLKDQQPENDLVLAAAAIPAQAGLLDAEALKPDGFMPRALAVANAGINESTTDLVYPGQAGIYVEGRTAAFARPFMKELAVHGLSLPLLDKNEIETKKPLKMSRQMPYAPDSKEALDRWCEDAVEIAARALAMRMKRIHVQSVTLGVSGGLDSTMALVTSLRAFDILGLPREGIYACSLPGLGSSNRTKNNAIRLMEAFDLIPREIDIKPSILRHFADIKQDVNTHDAAYENAQARERTQVLMDKANQLGGMMVGSGDLSELALGFTTYGGDHMSMYGVNAGLYKTAIRLILGHVAETTDNQSLKTVLLDILDTPISPELLPGQGEIKQKTEDILGPYVLNDFFLHRFLKDRKAPEDIVREATRVFSGKHDEDEIKTRLNAFFRRFFASQFKRNCLPDGPMVLGVSLSPRNGFILPSDASSDLYLSGQSGKGKQK